MYNIIHFFLSKLSDHNEDTDLEKLNLMKTDYDIYKENWGMNIYYNNSAGAAQNFGKYHITSSTQILIKLQWRNLD